MGLRDAIERLKYTRPKGSGEVKAAGGIIKKKFSGAGEALGRARERAQDRPLRKYKEQQDRRRMSELRVYGRELSEKERRDFERGRMEQQKRRVAMFAAPPAPRVSGRRIRQARLRPPAPRPLLNDPGIDFITGGGSVQSRRKKKTDLTLGGLL